MTHPISFHPSLPSRMALALAIAIPTLLEGAPKYLGPSAIVASPDGARLYVACADAAKVVSVDLASGKAGPSASVPGEPTGLVMSPDGKTLYATCGMPAGAVCLVDPVSMKVTATMPAGHTPTGLAPHPDGRRLYVCNRFNDDVSVIDVATSKELSRIPVVREPVGAVATPDGKTVYVINHLPRAKADGDIVAAQVTAIDAASGQTSPIPLPNGSTGLRGICITPDGKHVLVTHILARFHLPTTQLERGWQNTNALSIIDAANRRLVNTVLLDDVDLGAANPWGVACAPDGKWVAVAHYGTHEISLIDLPGVLAKIAQIPAELPAGGAPTYTGGRYIPASQAEVPNDLAFLVDLRRRVHLDGKGPRGVAIAGAKAYATMYFSDRLSAVDLAAESRAQAAALPIGPEPKWDKVRRGEVIFADATICFQHWQSCASCHPDARADGLNWDLLNDGIGNPKNNKSMLLTHKTPPAMFSGVRDSAEAAVRSGFRHILFAVVPDEDAACVDEYLKSLKPVPSPRLVGGKLSPAAERGKSLFAAPEVGCAECHPAPLFTNMKEYDLGTIKRKDADPKVDTPTLVECWRTAPYLHDGRYLDMRELLKQGEHGFSKEKPMLLSDDDLKDLAEYVLSL